MKGTLIALMLLALLAIAVFPGCSSSKVKNGDDNGGGNGRGDDVTVTDYDEGLTHGYQDGYDRGYADYQSGAYDPEPRAIPEGNEDFVVGYEEGFSEGYADGYGDARDVSSEDELVEVEAAMIAYVKANSASDLEFRIENIIIHGDEAAGRVICTSETLESPLVIMKKGPSGWYGSDFGTGIEPPAWYP
jgi:hypothetical protein